MIPLDTWLLVGTAGLVAWAGRRPITDLLWDGRKRFEAGQAGADTPRRVIVVVSPDGVHDLEVVSWRDGETEPSSNHGRAPREAARARTPHTTRSAA